MLLDHEPDYQLEHRAFFGRLSLQRERREVRVDEAQVTRAKFVIARQRALSFNRDFWVPERTTPKPAESAAVSERVAEDY